MHLPEIDPSYVPVVIMALRMVVPPITTAIRKWLRRTFIIIVVEREN